MNNWKLGIRMAAGFGIVILVTVLLGVFSYSRVSTLSDRNKDVTENFVPSLIVMGEVQANAERLYGIQLLHALYSDQAEMQGYDAELTTLRNRNSELLDHYQKDLVSNDTEAALIKKLMEARAEFTRGSEEFLAVSRKGDAASNAQALKLLYALRPVNDRYIQWIKDDIQFNKDLGDQEVKTVGETVNSAHMGILIGIFVSVLLAALIALYITRGIVQPIGMAVETLEKVADGDLTATLEVESKDEVGLMAKALNRAVERLNSTIREVAESAASASSSSQQLAAAAESISSGAQQQASSLEETSASLEEITAAVRHSADNAHQASQLAAGSKDSAQQGQEVVASAITAMAEINVASAKISDIISTIDEIAFQTNLLAVNAAVEAARAGDEGRGFAVVASEVRSLAQRSAVAAKEIKGLIQDSLRKVEAGSELVNRSGETLQGIVGSVRRVTDIVGEIAAASGEQSTGIEQVNTAMTQMDQVTQSNSAQTEELSATAQALADQSARLMELVSTFTLGQEGRNAMGRQAFQPRETTPVQLLGSSLVQAAKTNLAHAALPSGLSAQRPPKPARAKSPARPKTASRSTKEDNGAVTALAVAASSPSRSDASFEEF